MHTHTQVELDTLISGKRLEGCLHMGELEVLFAQVAIQVLELNVDSGVLLAAHLRDLGDPAANVRQLPLRTWHEHEAPNCVCWSKGWLNSRGGDSDVVFLDLYQGDLGLENSLAEWCWGSIDQPDVRHTRQ